MTNLDTNIGYAMIVNVIKYFEEQEKREDAISDQTNSVRAFRRLGFEIKLVTEIVPNPNEVGAETEYVTKHRFQDELKKAIDHVKNKGYEHFAVFISTHGGETRTGDHYRHELCFHDGDVSSEEILFNPLDRELPQVNKFILVSACRGRDDYDSDEDEDEDLGVQIQIVEDQDEEYQTVEYNTQHSLSENMLFQSITPCISNCVTMFASPSGKSAYRCHLANLFWDRVKLLSDGTRVNLLDLLREINRMFAEKEISMDKVCKREGFRKSYEVCNVGSICHSLTKPIHYTVVKNN